MKKFYTYVLVSLIIFASLSIEPILVKADDGKGPVITGVSFDRTQLTRGQKVEVVLLAEDPNGLASTAKIEILMPNGSIKILNPNLSGDRYRLILDVSRYSEYANIGVYQIRNVTVMDRYGNVTVTDFTNDTVQFEVLDDRDAPNIKEVKLSRNKFYSSWGENLEIQVSVDDIGKPANQAKVYFAHSKIGKEKSVELYYNEYDKTYRGYEWNWYDTLFGEWKVQRIEVADVAGNSSSVTGPFEGDNTFTVLNIEDDVEKPELISTGFTKSDPNSSIPDTYQIAATDNSFISEINATFKHRQTGKEVILYQNDAEFPSAHMGSGIATTANLFIDVATDFQNLSGFWDVVQINIIDRNQNKETITNINDSLYVEKYIADLGVRVIQENTTLSGGYITQDVFVMPGVLLSTLPNVTITNNLYALGAVRTYGGLSVYGTIYGNRMTFGHSSPIYDGDVQIGGSNSIRNISISDVTSFTLPLNTGGTLVKNEDDTFDIFGLTLPLANKISINGVETELSTNGRFKAFNIPMNEQKTANVQVTTTNGTLYWTSVKVYDTQKPTVAASKESGIYLAGTGITLSSTKDGTVYHDLNYGTGYSGQYINFYSDIVLNNDLSAKFYSVDLLGLESEIQEQKYRVFSVYSPRASDTFIQGSGSPGLTIQVEINDKAYSTKVNSEGRYLIEGLDLKEATYIHVFASDDEFTSEAYKFDVINDLPMVIKGVENNKVYNRDVTVTYNKGELYLSGGYYVNSGTTFTEEGTYVIYGYDYYSSNEPISFTIDKTAPSVDGVLTGKSYKNSIFPTFIEGTATLNGLPYISNTKIEQEGDYILEVTDQAGNKTNVNFVLDYTAPIISGIENGKIYNQYVTPKFNEGTAKLNGVTFVSGTVIKSEGLHELVVKDMAGNTTTHKFEIDVTPPKITNVIDGGTYRRGVINFTDGVAVLNGLEIQTGHEVTKDGKYNLEVTDRAGNVTTISFEVDTIVPVVSGVENGVKYNRSVTPIFVEGTGKLNSQPFASGKLIQSEGAYELIVEDKAGNVTTTQFSIDLTAPIVTGVETNRSYNRSVIISFNEGTATLNGKAIAKNYTVDKDGSYNLKVKDLAGNETTIVFVVDQLPPVVTGVEAKTYRDNVIPIFTETSATLNGIPFISGTMIVADGEYELKVVDQAANETIIRFKIDKQPVDVTGVESGKTYQEVTPVFKEGTARLNGNIFTSGTRIYQSGDYTLIVTDEAGNENKILFTIDRVAPEVKGFIQGKTSYREVTPTFTEGNATLNGKPFVSGTTISTDGEYELKLHDKAGNETIVRFTIDRKPVVVAGVENGKAYQQAKAAFTEGTAKLNGVSYTSGTLIALEGDHVLIVTDEAENETIVRFKIDRKPVLVTGVESGKVYQQIKPIFTEGIAKLNGTSYTSGTLITLEGSHILVVTDEAGNETIVSFKIDRTPVMVTGVENGKIYQQAKPTFTEGTAKLNGVAYLSGTSIALEGNHTLIVTDEAGNETKISFTIDHTAPIVNGFIKDKSSYREVTPTFTEGVATLNGKPFVTGTKIATDGEYELKVTDMAGNETIVRFKIDRKPVIVTGIEEGKTYQQAKPNFTEGTAKLNGVAYTSGTLITLEGNHVLLVTDGAGNETKISFTIDHTAPVIKGFLEGKSAYREVTPTFTEGAATLNGQPFASGTIISSDGDYELKVKDQAGNETTVRFKIDRKPVTVTGVESGKTYQQVKPIFTEGVGKLNGASYVSGTTIDQTGNYVLIVTDDAGNETKFSFSIDRTPPVISGFVEGKQSYREVTPSFSEGTALLNGKTFASGTKLVQEGKYVLKVTDQIGNVTTREFIIDRTTPIVSGVTSKQLTNKSVTVFFNEGSATLNGKNIASGQTVEASGSYTLKVTDEAGNVTLLTFTIDKVAPSKPSISTLTNKSTKVTGKAEKGSTVSITYNGRTYTTKASTAGTYSYSLKTTKAGTTVTVRAKDAAGNLSTTASSKVLNTFATFTVNTVKSNTTSVTGKGNRAATVQAFVGTKSISKTAKVDSKGNYKLTIPRQKAGVTVTVKMTQTGYQELKKTTKVVK